MSGLDRRAAERERLSKVARGRGILDGESGGADGRSGRVVELNKISVECGGGIATAAVYLRDDEASLAEGW